MSASADHVFEHNIGFQQILDEGRASYYLGIPPLTRVPLPESTEQPSLLVENYGYPDNTDTTALPSFEGQLGLYGNAESHPLADFPRQHFEDPLLLRSGRSSLPTADSGYGPSVSGNHAWYGTPAENSLSPFIESFQDGSNLGQNDMSHFASHRHYGHMGQGPAEYENIDNRLDLAAQNSSDFLGIKTEPGTNNVHLPPSSVISSPLSSQPRQPLLFSF